MALDGLAYAPQYPVVCDDERPCFLIGERLEPVALQRSQLRKEHYASEKRGSAALVAAIDPLTGRRLAQLHQRRTKREYTLFCQALAKAYPETRRIQLVQHNLNPHGVSPFYEKLPTDEALALAARFDFHFTPKSASWLNMIEIEFSALARLCLNRRISTFDQLQAVILAFFAHRHHNHIKINWHFSVQKARHKLNSPYTAVHSVNSIFVTS